MHTPTRIAALTLSTAVLCAIPATMAASSAASEARSWTTIGKFAGAQHQACKVLINGGETWKINTRLVNGHDGEVGAGMTVQKDGKDTKRTWNSGFVAEGQTSKLGAVTLPKGDDKYSLVAFQYQSQAGDGGPLKLKKIGHC